MAENDVQIEASWKEALAEEFQKPYFLSLKAFLKQEIQAGKTIYPPGKFIFNAFNSTPFDQVKVVILGQDPYHGPKQAHGLCFSVQHDVPAPPSLVNIYKELHSDLGLPIPQHGNLQHWANQGVLLLNAMLTVEAHKAGSHKGKGWETFTDAVIKKLNDEREGLIFLLWGSYAQAKGAHINTQRHHVLKTVHPSPLSAYNGFFGCKHFSQTNALLEKMGKQAIDWKV